MKNSMIAYLGSIKALIAWFHAAHHVTKGSSFAGDHVNLYGEIYQKIIEDFDAVAEKAIVAFDSESVACPIALTNLSHKVLLGHESPCNMSADQIAAFGLEVVRAHLQRLEELYRMMHGTDVLSLGMEDLIASSANMYESFIYLLTQRVKRGNSFQWMSFVWV